MFFDKLRPEEKTLIFKGLKALVEQGDPSVFHNGDPGHPIYVAGANGVSVSQISNAAIPTESSPAFLMLRELTIELKSQFSTFIWWKDFSSWQKFCEVAVSNYRARVLSKS